MCDPQRDFVLICSMAQPFLGFQLHIKADLGKSRHPSSRKKLLLAFSKNGMHRQLKNNANHTLKTLKKHINKLHLVAMC